MDRRRPSRRLRRWVWRRSFDREDEARALIDSMMKLLWSGVIIFVALPLLCYGVGLALVWVADTWGIWVGARNV